MSCDFGILNIDKKITNDEASELYVALCEGDISGVTPSTRIDEFYKELTSMHPEIDDIPEEEIDNTDLCPWSIAFDRSPGHLIVSCVWPKADYVVTVHQDIFTATDLMMVLGNRSPGYFYRH